MRRTRRLLPLLLVLAVLAGLAPAAAAPAGSVSRRSPADAMEDLARFVDPRNGTNAPGFVFPGATTPFGMVQVSPDTESPFAYAGYLWSDQTIRGFSMVHVSGPGVPKGGDVPFLPTVGPVTTSNAYAFAEPFSHATESASPGDYRVRLNRSQVDVELTASRRAGWLRATYPPSPQSNMLLDLSRSVEDNTAGALVGRRRAELRITGDREISGWVRGRYPVYFVARFDRPFTATGTWSGSTLRPGTRDADGIGIGGWVTFDTTTSRTVTAAIGISFVDVDGARRNLEAETEGTSFDEVRTAARRAWNVELNRVRVTGGTDLDKAAFYTALYRAQLHPNTFSDVDGRYRGMDDQVHDTGGREHYANFASWDTYKGHNQLMATIQPARYRDMVLSQLDNARKQGRIPRFGEHSIDASHMSGDPALPMVVDGWCRGLLRDVPQADLDELYRYLTELNTRHRNPAMAGGRWLPDRPGTTLEYGVADFALALIADATGRPDDAERWAADAQRWRTVLDPETRWVRPRKADGSWHSPFDPADETGFQEGNSWQYSWLAPHDARGVFDAMGGDAVAVERLDSLFAHPLASTVPLVVAEVHSRLNVFGLVYRTATYAPGNEHDLQIPWMYPFAGQPWKTQAVHRQVQGLFRALPDGLPGNDDLGGLSGWYLWSAMGIGPVTPGAPFLVVGSPMFERVELLVPGRPAFVIEAPGASAAAKYVSGSGATLDGKPLDKAWFSADAIADGGTLRLPMSVTPDTTWGTGRDARPPSASDSPLSAFGCRP